MVFVLEFVGFILADGMPSLGPVWHGGTGSDSHLKPKNRCQTKIRAVFRSRK